MTARPHPWSFLFVTLDSCRYDTFDRADAPNLKSVGPLHSAHAPGNFTLSSHAAMFVGFTPGVADVAEPYVNPKFERIFRMEREDRDAEGPGAFVRVRGRNIIDGLHGLGYRSIGTGAVGWFNPRTAASAVLVSEFQSFFYPGNSWSLDDQLDFLTREVRDAGDTPVFAFLNIGETHVPYYHAGARWSRDNPCIPFSTDNDADECRRRQAACVEFVDARIGPLLRLFEDANTIVCADHGDAWGEGGIWEHNVHHPKVMEVPLLLRLQQRPAVTDDRARRSSATTRVRGRLRKSVRRAARRLERLTR